VKDLALEWGYRSAWRLVRMLPGRVAYRAFRVGADRAARKRGAGVERLAENLRVVVGEAMPADEFDTLIRDAMRSYARYWCDAFRASGRSLEQHLAAFRLVNDPALSESHARGKGVVLALPHAGNWDAAGAWVVARGMPLTTVAERLKPEAVYERFLAFRRGLGMEILPLTGGDRPVIDALDESLREGKVVALLADRDFSKGGVPVIFFGRKTRMPAGPAILALRTGAPLHTVDMWYEPDGPAARLSEPIMRPDTAGSMAERVAIMTQAMADSFEAGIRAHPADWHMLARMFVAERARPAERVEA